MLLANELVANAYKHAFPDGRTGTIEVGLRRLTVQSAQLSVVDDGVGFDPSTVKENLGLQLVRQLAGQLLGAVEMTSQAGTAATVTFACAPAAPKEVPSAVIAGPEPPPTIKRGCHSRA
jgi:two-component sensor histidine kinase